MRSVSFRVQCLGMRLAPKPPWPRRTLKDHPNTWEWGSQGRTCASHPATDQRVHGDQGVQIPPRGSWGDKGQEFKEQAERKGAAGCS